MSFGKIGAMTADDDSSPAKAALTSNDRARQPRKRRPRRTPEGTLVVLERLLSQPRPMNLDGVRTQVPTIKFIMLQLMQKEMSGDRRAQAVLLEYKEFASRGGDQPFEIHFSEGADEPGDD